MSVQYQQAPHLVTFRMHSIYGQAADRRLSNSDLALSPSDPVDQLAEFVLQNFHKHQSEISVIAFNRSDSTSHTSKLGPRCYMVRGPKLEGWEEKRASMVYMKTATVRLEEPRSEVLDVQHGIPEPLRFRRLPRRSKPAAIASREMERLFNDDCIDQFRHWIRRNYPRR